MFQKLTRTFNDRHTAISTIKPETWSILLLIILTLIIYLGSSGFPPLLDDSDSFYAEVAREMNSRHDWITPYANSIRFMEKPPLFYWLISLSFAITDTANAFTARLPTAITITALALVTFKIGKLLFGWRTGLFGSLALATSAGMFLLTRVLFPDALFTLFLALVIYSFLCWEKSERKTGALLWIYAFSGLAVLAKGLIGVVFPVAILSFTLLLTGRAKEIFRLISLKGILLFLIIAAPWHILMGIRNPGFFWFYFINEHVLRFLGKRYPMDYGMVPLGAFWLLHMVWLFPWSIYLVTLCRPARIKFAMREHGSNLVLLLVWAFTILLFFSFSSRLEYYSLPALPALALLAGMQCERSWEKGWKLPGRALATVGILVGVIFVIVGVFVTAGGTDGVLKLKEHHGLYFYHFDPLLDLPLESIYVLRTPLLLAGLGLGLVLPLHIWLKKGEVKAGILATAMIIFFSAANLGFLIFAPRLTSKPIADEIRGYLDEKPVIILDGSYEEASSVAFYTGQPVLLHNGRSYNLEYGSYYTDAPQLFLSDTELEQYWRQRSKRLFLVTSQSRLAHLERIIPHEKYIYAKYGNKVLFSNIPVEVPARQEVSRVTGGENPDTIKQ